MTAIALPARYALKPQLLYPYDDSAEKNEYIVEVDNTNKILFLLCFEMGRDTMAA
jgi:hypothetical protein